MLEIPRAYFPILERELRDDRQSKGDTREYLVRQPPEKERNQIILSASIILSLQTITNERSYQSLPKTLASKVFRTDNRVGQGRNARGVMMLNNGLGTHLNHKGRTEQRLIQLLFHGFC
jgi:hypothetical protein